MRSKFEVRFAADLKKRRIKYEYEGTKLSYVLHKNYLPDFTITTVDGRVMYIETKGRLTQTDRAKLLAVRRDHPDLDLRIVFQRSTERLSRRSSTTYGMWAERNGFLYADGTLPKEWLE